MWPRDAYDLSHVLDAKRLAKRARAEPLKKTYKGGHWEVAEAERVERMRLVWRSLPRPAKALLQLTQEADEIMARFQTAVNLARCQPRPALGAALTVTLSALHEAGQLSSPDKVSEGRLAYESIRRDTMLLSELGIH